MLKIHSKFQDYYDSALGSFTESDVSVIRKKSVAEIYLKDLPDFGEFDGKWDVVRKNRYGTAYGYRQVVLVGFCGIWYYFVADFDMEPAMDPDDVEYSKASNIEYKTFGEIVDNNSRQSLFRWKQDKEFKDPNDIPYMKDLFEKYGPVLLIKNFRPQPKAFSSFYAGEKLKIEIWPELKHLDFQKVKDPYTALWEIEHWYDSHARPDDAVVPVGDDVTRLQAYGFDKKTSFRKAKEK